MSAAPGDALVLRPPFRRLNGRATCPWPDCRCTHEEPCDRGWIEQPPDAAGYVSVRPCSTCRPVVAQLVTMAAAGEFTAEQLSHELRQPGRARAVAW